MKISICTTVMSRLAHFSKTIERNIKDSDEDVEFIVLDYNSEDGLEEWVRSNLMSHIESGKLAFYREQTATAWMPSHSRNICALQATGTVICNVDADNYTGPGFADELREMFKEGGTTIAAAPDILKFVNGSTHGRIALRKSHFKAIGGYDEAFVYGWGGEDNDLFRRCQHAGFKVRHFSPKHLNYIPHGEADRLQKVDFSPLKGLNKDFQAIIGKRLAKEKRTHCESDKMRSRLIHDGISDQNVAAKRYVANVGKSWGVASLVKNFTTPCTSGVKALI